jgi:hypothetical protein
VLSETDSDSVVREIIPLSSMAPAEHGNMCMQVLNRERMSLSAQKANTLKAKAVAAQQRDQKEEEDRVRAARAQQVLPTHYLV